MSPTHAASVKKAPFAKSIGRSRLADIGDTLPPHKEGRDRKLRFEPDGTIVYEHEEGDEPPKDISGYQRDPNDPYRFTPLWLSCGLRQQQGVRFAVCGCIDVIMRCGNPASPMFGSRISHVVCKHCQLRQAENEESA